MQVHAEHERRLAGIALRKQRAEQAREDVAHPGARHAGIARCVDEPVTVARHHHAAVALQHDVGLEFLREAARRGDAVRLDVCGFRIEQPRRLGGVRRQQRVGLPPRAGVAQIGVVRHQVQRVGIEHARDVAGKRGADQGFGALALADAGPGDERVELLAERIVRVAQHELQRVGVDAGRLVIEQPDVDPAGAELQGRASSEQRRAGHACGAAEDRHRAGHALMEVARPRPEHAAEQLRAGQPGRRPHQAPGIQPELRDANLAAVIGPIEREQPRLERNEAEGVSGAHRVAEHAARIRIDAARHIESEDRAALLVRIVDQPGKFARDRLCQADAEQAVDDQRPAFVARQRCRIRHLGHGDAEKPLAQALGADFRVAAVVAGPGEDQDVLARVRSKAGRGVGGGEAGALHERRRRIRRGLLDAADIGGKIDRGGHGVIVSTALPEAPQRSVNILPGR